MCSIVKSYEKEKWDHYCKLKAQSNQFIILLEVLVDYDENSLIFVKGTNLTYE
jgi:hypothetical protein